MVIHHTPSNVSVDGVPTYWTDFEVRNAFRELERQRDPMDITLPALQAVLATPCVDMAAHFDRAGFYRHGTSRLYKDE